jgi:hypothetical protein
MRIAAAVISGLFWVFWTAMCTKPTAFEHPYLSLAVVFCIGAALSVGAYELGRRTSDGRAEHE